MCVDSDAVWSLKSTFITSFLGCYMSTLGHGHSCRGTAKTLPRNFWVMQNLFPLLSSTEEADALQQNPDANACESWEMLSIHGPAYPKAWLYISSLYKVATENPKTLVTTIRGKILAGELTVFFLILLTLLTHGLCRLLPWMLEHTLIKGDQCARGFLSLFL